MDDRRTFLLSLLGMVAAASCSRSGTRTPGTGFALTPPPDPTRARWRDVLLAARRRQIERIDSYARAGQFPINRDFPDVRTPYFVDERGTHCAVAFLMMMDGREDDVQAIAQANNHVRVMDVTDGPLVEWVRTSGLLQEEAALVQPSYDFEGRETFNPRAEEASRIQDHLFDVRRALDASTESSLEIALDRLLAG